MVLEKINQPNDIKKLEPSEYDILAAEIRDFLLDKLSNTGGHLASNLGVVELTMAMHLAFNLPEDKVVWDVGHQSYTHKILSGRKDHFDDLRQFKGLSGFPKRRESEFDAFDTGHSSTSISAGLGIVQGRELLGQRYNVVSVIGDGALTGGMAYEALNNASRLKTNFIIVLNDNNMSISENVGGMSRYLGKLRTDTAYTEFKENLAKTLTRLPVFGDEILDKLIRTKSGIKQLFIPGMLFENMGITYLGPVDGHNIRQMLRVFSEAKRVNHAVLIHVMTKKGKGYLPAEKNPSKFHSVDTFDIATGLPKKEKKYPSYTDVFAKEICNIAQQDSAVVAITAAMPDGTGLKRFSRLYPDRFFDVGIAEAHGVTFAAGMAVSGLKPVVAVYSSFLQRAFDQALHDVCIQNLPVVFAVDRAGLVGSDGETHQGIFDLSFLGTIPNMTIMAPKNRQELRDMLWFAVNFGAPIAIRYPRGEAYRELTEYRAPVVYGKSEVISEEGEVALFAAGNMVKTAVEVKEMLKDRGISSSLVNARFVKPIDTQMLDYLAENHRVLVTMEENVMQGGFGQRVLEYMNRCWPKVRVVIIALPDAYVEHGNVELLKEELSVDSNSITVKIVEEYMKEERA